MLYFTYGNLFILIFCFQSEAFLFTQTPPCDVSVSECMNCERVGFFPTMFCPQIEYGEFCYTKVVHNDSGIFTIKGHASKSFCEANNYKTSILNPSCKTGNLPKGTECIDCCKQYSCDPRDLYCNKNIIKPEHMPFTVTTIRTTPPTKVSTTTATPQPTTPLPTTTQAPDKGLCQVCVESDGRNCDTSSSNQYCSQQKKYCMNTIISDPKGGMIVLKKCADEVECKWNYWVDTLGDPKCNNVTGPQADNACSYCCDNTNGNLPCNRNTIPTQLSTFDNSQEKKQCMTGTSNTQYQLETCSSVASYCLNTVRYDTTAKDPDMYVEKKCAYEAECKGEWWNKSRKRPDCLTQNFTGIADNSVICTYCCVSDGSGPCNGASVPEQIAHFEPVTTATTTLPTTAHGHGHHNTHVHTDHGHHHTVTTTQTTTESTTTTATLPSTTQSIHTSTTSPSTTTQTTATTLPSTTTTTATTTATTMPTSTTTPAPIVCSGNTSIVCEDDPLAHCATLLSVGLCQKLQYNPDREDIKFCPKTCNLCDKYCEYVLKPKQPPTTTPAPTHQMTTNATTIKPLTTTNKASTTSPTANITTNTTAGTTSSNPTTKATISFIHKSTVTTTNKDQITTATMSTTSTNPTTTATTATTTTGTTATTTTATTTSTNTATTATTTTTILTTTTAAHPECYICTGPVTLCENLYAPQSCTSDKPFCINEVNNNSDGTRTVARRCASKTECIQNWWLGSSSRSECAGFDPTSPTLDQFSCSFCCTTPLCNKNIVPRDLYVQ
nr:mucin-5AC isoform X2 [Crassostrea gigas]